MIMKDNDTGTYQSVFEVMVESILWWIPFYFLIDLYKTVRQKIGSNPSSEEGGI